METSRFFVSNLPVNVQERDLRNLFQDYGEVGNIVLKTKENLVDPDDIKVIAFVTLNIGADNTKYCLNDLNWQKVHGRKINVSLAKESFLERLKREREEAKVSNNLPVQPREPSSGLQPYLLKTSRDNKRKTFDVNGELNDDEVASELMITKKRAVSSIHNGKIIIQSINSEPIHVIASKQKKAKLLDKKCSRADHKRKESLNKMKIQYEQNKTAIQQALQDLDGNDHLSKKIKFTDVECEEGRDEKKEDKLAKKSKTNLFDSDDENVKYDMDFTSVPLGKKGEKLIQMQAKQSLDARFRIDTKFLDDEGEVENDENNKCRKSESVDDDDVDDERQWQMNILEQVVGTKLDMGKHSEKSNKNRKMLRYDPSRDEHKKFERNREYDENIIIKHKEKQSNTKDLVNDENNINTQAPPIEVSKEVFYVVTDTLQQSLRTRGDGFSLLNMFGNSEQLNERDEQLKQLGNEKILINNNKLEKSFAANPFTYDSSSESESDEISNIQDNLNHKDEESKDTKSKKKFKIQTESFFIPKNDVRLKEGSKFFIYHRNDDAAVKNYEEVRNRLKLLIKTKITKTKKNLANAGYKGKRKV